MKRTFFFFISMLCVGAITAQVHMRNTGALLHISSGAQVQCPGSLTLAEKGAQTAHLHIEGDLLLAGDLINEVQESPSAGELLVSGTLSLMSQIRKQYIKGHKLVLTNLVLRNSYGLQTENDLVIRGRLTLREGKVFVADGHALHILHPAPGAISSFSDTSYIVGKLRRTVYPGDMHFPIGSDSHSQFVQVSFARPSGLDFLEVEFSDNPISLSTPVEVDGARIYEFLDNGSWTIRSDAESRTPFRLRLRSQGQSNASQLAGAHTFLSHTGFGWEPLGHLNRDESYGMGMNPIVAVRDSLTSLGQFAIGKAGYPLSVPEDPLIGAISISNNGSSAYNRTIMFSADSSFEYSVELRDMRGRDLLNLSRRSLPGLNQVILDISPYPKGLYSLVLRRKGELHEIRVW